MTSKLTRDEIEGAWHAGFFQCLDWVKAGTIKNVERIEYPLPSMAIEMIGQALHDYYEKLTASEEDGM